jgi:hypothetical protein
LEAAGNCAAAIVSSRVRAKSAEKALPSREQATPKERNDAAFGEMLEAAGTATKIARNAE